MLISLMSAAIAAILSYWLNRYSLSKLGRLAVTLEGPVTEEVLKTLAAIAFRAPVLYTHVFFGVFEAGYDVFHSANHRTGSHAALAALLSVAGHTLFGGITVYCAWLIGYWQAGVLVAVLFHSAWNRTLLR